MKLRGHRVEPAETEAAALTHPAVRDCAVVARTDGDRHYLAAYAVLDGTCDAGRSAPTWPPGCPAISSRPPWSPSTGSR
ncbi:hypothetical protein ACFQ2B_31580 [Streptomyces stramineus]